MDPIGSVHVGVAGRSKHWCIARGAPGEAVGGRFVRRVGFRLDDRSADAVDQEDAPDKLARNHIGGPRA